MSPQTSKVQLFVMPASVLYSGHSASWLTYVGLEEQEKAAGYRNRDDAVSYAAQHTLMRCIAASALDVRPTQAHEILVDRTCHLCDSGELHGKPQISGISISMSRAQGMVTSSFSRRSDVVIGTDIEKMRGNYYAGFDNIALSPDEKDFLQHYSGSTQNVLRLMLWTAKEAVLKATGHGLSVSPSTVHVTIEDFPDEVTNPVPYSATAQLTLPDFSSSIFYLDWQVQDDYIIATASPQPLDVTKLVVSTPLDVKKAVQSPAVSQ